MHRITLVVLASLAFALIAVAAGPAKAGGYAYGSNAGFSPYAWIPRDCCAGPIAPPPLVPVGPGAPGAPALFAPPVVPAVPGVRYLRLVEQLPDCAYCDSPPARFGANPYWPPDCAYGGCPAYLAAPRPASDLCWSRRVRVLDRRGHWIWRVKTICR